MADEENDFVSVPPPPRFTFQCFYLLLIGWHVAEQEQVSSSLLCMLTLRRASKFPVVTVMATS